MIKFNALKREKKLKKVVGAFGYARKSWVYLAISFIIHFGIMVYIGSLFMKRNIYFSYSYSFNINDLDLSNLKYTLKPTAKKKVSVDGKGEKVAEKVEPEVGFEAFQDNKGEEVIVMNEQYADFTLHQPRPTYPVSAIKRRQQGLVVLRAKLKLNNNTVNDIYIYKSSSFDVLDKSAIDAISRWNFDHPLFKRSGDLIIEIPVNFEIRE